MKKFFFHRRLSNYFLILLTMFLFASPALAQLSPAAANNLGNQLQAVSGPTGANIISNEDPRILAVRIVLTIMTLIGTIFFALTVYAGFLWFTAGGNEEQVEKAKKLLRDGVIGLVIILCSYTITIVATNIALGRSIGYGTVGSENLNQALGSSLKNSAASIPGFGWLR